MKTPTSMISTHQATTAPWFWPLRGAARLPAAGVGRWLLLVDGNLWLTRSEGDAGLSDDIWLAAGQRLWLPADSEWVIEAWPAAQFELLLAPPVAAELNAAGGWRRFLRPTWRQVLQTARPAARQASASASACA